MTVSLHPFAEHLALAALMGAVIGLERQWHQGMAGLRTNALVALSASAYVSLPQLLNEDGTGPAHMAVAVITGIGFLGAGVILRQGSNVRGLNTAATLWGAASMGAFVGVGLLAHAVTIAACILVVNVGMRPLVAAVNWAGARFGMGSPTGYVIEVTCTVRQQRHVRALLLRCLAEARLKIRGLEIRGSDAGLKVVAEVIAYSGRDLVLEQLVGALSADAAISAARWSMQDSLETDPRLHMGS